MTKTATPVPMADQEPICTVKKSRIQGNGVFATRKIAADTCIFEYKGKRVTVKQAEKAESPDSDNPYHTFYFGLKSGKLIDAAQDGNDARWINHGCEPNCEAREEKGRIYIYALHDIRRGEELRYDYGLALEERHTAALKRAYACRCGAPTCRHTMLAPKSGKPKAAEAA